AISILRTSSSGIFALPLPTPNAASATSTPWACGATSSSSRSMVTTTSETLGSAKASVLRRVTTTTFLHSGFLIRSCTMRPPPFPVAPSTIAEYCAFAPPLIVPAPCSYSRRISSNSSTFVLLEQSTEILSQMGAPVTSRRYANHPHANFYRRNCLGKKPSSGCISARALTVQTFGQRANSVVPQYLGQQLHGAIQLSSISVAARLPTFLSA